MLPHVMTNFTDYQKQKHLVVLVALPTGVAHYNMLVALPTGVAHYNTTNMDNVVGSTHCKLQIIIFWLPNMTDVMKLLSQFLGTWHGANINMWQCLVIDRISA